MIVNIYEAKTQLSQLIKQVILGETVVIARDGVPVAQLVAVVAAQTARVPGLGQGKMILADDWDSTETNARVAALMFGEPLPEDAALPRLAVREPKTAYTTRKSKASKPKPRTTKKVA
jgi:antitoxin (DNA-binding transcriptional repressor) of toxin-antitoxin stability system